MGRAGDDEPGQEPSSRGPGGGNAGAGRNHRRGGVCVCWRLPGRGQEVFAQNRRGRARGRGQARARGGGTGEGAAGAAPVAGTTA